MSKESGNGKDYGYLILLGLAVGVVLLIVWLQNNRPAVVLSDSIAAENKVDSINKNAPLTKDDSLKRTKKILAELDVTIKDIEDLSNQSTWTTTDGILAVPSKIESIGLDFWKYDNEKSPEIRDKIKNIKRQLGSQNVKIFPKLREKYGTQLNSKLWEEDMVVSVDGKSKSTITFIGGIFARNKNIKVFHENVASKLNLLRYKRVNYKWSKHIDEYTYYDLENSPDTYY